MSCSLSSSTSTSPSLTTLSTFTCITLMMPFAFDLISTFVSASSLPVATTDFTIVPRSTGAIRAGSTSGDAPLSVANPATAATATIASAPPMNRPFRDFFVRAPIRRSDEIGTQEVHNWDDRLRYGRMWILQSATARAVIFLMPDGGVKTLGRARRADFRVGAPLVSRLHGRLKATDYRLEGEGLKSTNGTFVNDQRVERAGLATGDRLRVGRMELTVEKAKD